MFRRVGIAFATALVLASSVARAETEESFYYSDDASLVGGAVTAWTRDAGAIWYNPAGLGGGVRSQITLNGTVYALKFRSISDALRSTFPGAGVRSIDISSTDIMSAPHATAFVRSLSDDVSIGIGIYITERDVRTAQNTLSFFQAAGPGLAFDANMRQHLDVAFERTKYEVGPAIGFRLAPNLRVGANAFLTYAKTTGLAMFELDIIGTTGTPPPTVFSLGSEHATTSELGAVGTVGVQWEPTPSWSVGATIRAPSVRFRTSIDGTNITAQGVVVPGVPAAAVLELVKARTNADNGIVIPPRAVVGIGHAFGDRVFASVEGDFLPAMESTRTGMNTRNIVNARGGVKAVLHEKFVAGIGAFSDRDRNVLGDGFTDERVDRYGVTAGFQLLTPFDLAGDNGQPNDPVDARRVKKGGLVLATTLSMRYAVGLGEVRALDIDFVNGGTRDRVVDVTYHELTPYIGSAVSF